MEEEARLETFNVTEDPAATSLKIKKIPPDIVAHFITALEVGKLGDSAASFPQRMAAKSLTAELQGAPVPRAAYRADGFAKEIIEEMSDLLKAEDIALFKTSPVIGVGADETTGVSVTVIGRCGLLVRTCEELRLALKVDYVFK